MGEQVYFITHDKEGNSLNPIDKNFISFSYGGKNIEDFDLIVTNVDRYNRILYPQVKNTETSYQGVHGKMFWEFSYDSNIYSFNLSTDGINDSKLEEFKHFFKPGVYREFILAEHPNRKALARVSSAPQLNVIPFEKEIEIKINNIQKKIKTTTYKGDITLELIIDYPFWESINSYTTSNTNDNLKIILEDGIPTKEMFVSPCFLANGYYYNGTNIESNKEIALTKNTNLYLYYCGTSDGNLNIKATITISISDDGFIIIPENSYSENNNSYFKINNRMFYFTTPNILTSYNKSLEIVNSFNVNDSIIDLRKKIRDEINHYYTRAWSIAILDGFRGDSNHSYCSAEGALKGDFKRQFLNLMKIFIQDNNGNNFDLTFNCNSKTNLSTILIKCRTADTNLLYVNDAKSQPIIDIEENSGDMVKSEYLKLEDRKIYNSNGKITSSECSIFNSSIDLKGVKLEYSYEYL